MGVDAGDYDGDGAARSLILTHFSFETNTLYRNLGGAQRSRTAHLGDRRRHARGYSTSGSARSCSTGTTTAIEDLFVANGHISDNIERYNPTEAYRQQDQLLRESTAGVSSTSRQRAGVDDRAGTRRSRRRGRRRLRQRRRPRPVGHQQRRTGRDPPQRPRRRHHWITLELTLPSGAPAVGAEVVIESGGTAQRRAIAAGSSYLSQGDPRVHFGLGSARVIERCEIRWPDGSRHELTDPSSLLNHITSIQQTTE